MVDIFISYAREDMTAVQSLRTELQKHGWSVFTDTETPIGLRWDQHIPEQLRAAQCVLVCWSQVSIASEYVAEEARYAKEHNVLIPARLQNVEPPFGFSHRSYADLFDWHQGKPHPGFDQLLARIKDLVQSRSHSTTPRILWRMRTPDPLAPEIELLGRNEEYDQLRALVGRPRPPLVCIHGPMGSGKSFLMLNFVNSIASQCDDGVIGIWYPFPSKESKDSLDISSAQFFAQSLRAFDYKEGLRDNEDERWQKVEELLRSRRCLLFLDGLENLQEPNTERGSDGRTGRITDDPIDQLLRNLARRPPENSLVVVGSRYPLVDLRQFGAFGGYFEIELGPIKPQAGAEILKKMKIHGGGFNDEAERKRLCHLSEELGGNPLTIVLVGSILSKQFNGDVRSWDIERPQFRSTVVEYATVVMAWHNKFLTDTERAFLMLLGLFGRKMEEEEFSVLLRSRVGQQLKNLSNSQLNQMYSRLAEYNLLSGKGQHPYRWDSWDTHTLVREYFGSELRNKNPYYWQNAHSVLFDHYTRSSRQFGEEPEFLELTRMFGAVRHGCLAGRYVDAYNFYRFSIAQNWKGYDTEKRGAVTEALITINSFFPQESYDRAVEELSSIDVAWLQARASYCLESQGKFKESAYPRQESNRTYHKLYDAAAEASYEAFERARDLAYGSEELAGIRMRIGDLSVAEQDAHDAVKWAEVAVRCARTLEEADTWPKSAEGKDAVPPWLRQCSTLSALGAVLHWRGNLKDAAAEFDRARAIHGVHDTNWVLHSEPGVRYCALRLDQASNYIERERILEYAKQMQMWGATDHISGLHLMIEGRALVELGRYLDAKDALNDAVDLAQKSNKIQFLCEPLLVRAGAQRLSGELGEAQKDVDQVLNISRATEMLPYQADGYLLSAHIALDKTEYELAKKDLQEARRAVRAANNQNCYRLRLPDLFLLQARIEYVSKSSSQTVTRCLHEAEQYITTIGRGSLYQVLQRYKGGCWER